VPRSIPSVKAGAAIWRAARQARRAP